MSRQDRRRSPSRGGWNSGSSGAPAAAAITECSWRTEVSTPVPMLKRWPPPLSPDGPDECVDDVVDEDVVAGVGAVAENLRGLAGEQCSREDGDHAGFTVRILARAVDVGRRDVRALQAVEIAEGVEVDLAGHLAGGVRRRWIDRRRLRWLGRSAVCRISIRPTRCARSCGRPHGGRPRRAAPCRRR